MLHLLRAWQCPADGSQALRQRSPPQLQALVPRLVTAGASDTPKFLFSSVFQMKTHFFSVTPSVSREKCFP